MSIVPSGQLVWGMQMPIQSQSTIFAQPWESAAGPAELAQVAEAADAAGAFYIAVCDHIAIPQPLDQTMSGTWYDTVATLGWLAARTTRTHLLSHVAVLPYRHPLVTAKQWCTLDALSEGRAILGVGAGHVQGEFDLLGLDFTSRGAALDAAILGVRAAFENEVVEGAVVAPRPHRRGGPPIWVGGSSPAAMRRAARLGDGWLPQGPPEMGMAAAIELIRTERERALGPDAVPIDLGGFSEPIYLGKPAWDVGRWTATGTAEEVAERLSRHKGSGISHLQVRFASRSAEELVEQISRFGAEVWPKVIQ